MSDTPTTRSINRMTARLTAVVAASLALIMAAAVAVPVEHTSTDEVVGTLDTSMVELLGSVNSANAVTMAELRLMIANSSQVTDAGRGIDVAVIDSGVAPVPGLDGKDKVLHGPDLSFEGESPQGGLSRHLRSRHAHCRDHRRHRRQVGG